MQISQAVNSLEDLPENSGFRVGFSTRADGNMSYRLGHPPQVRRDRARYFSGQGISPERVVTFFTEHQDDIYPELKEADLRTDALAGEKVLTTDAIVTTLPDSAIFLTFADCVPCIVYDTRQHLMAFAHIGWRSMAMGFTRKLLDHLIRERRCNPGDLRVVLGPSIKKESYLFEDPIQAEVPAWQPYIHPHPDGRYAIDLPGFCIAQTLEAGISPAQIFASKIDTAHDERMFSHYAGTVGDRPAKQGRFVFYGHLLSR